MKNYSTQNVSIDNLHGKVEFNLTNDYMFRAVFQTNEVALTGLLCALLRLDEEDIKHIEIQNPIELGNYISDKEFRLDIKILLNDERVINLEMQVNNLGNWPERSLSYACRMFDNLNRGSNYKNVIPVIQIGILDFTPFDVRPCFFDTYMMMDEDGNGYSEKLAIKTLDLTRTDLATETDKRYNLDKWARIFKVSTWDELKALSGDNKFFKEAAKSMRLMTEEDELRERMIEREEYYARQRYLEERAKRADEAEAELNAAKARIAELEQLLNVAATPQS